MNRNLDSVGSPKMNEEGEKGGLEEEEEEEEITGEIQNAVYDAKGK